jgi:hypothetical protein
MQVTDKVTSQGWRPDTALLWGGGTKKLGDGLHIHPMRDLATCGAIDARFCTE